MTCTVATITDFSIDIDNMVLNFFDFQKNAKILKFKKSGIAKILIILPWLDYLYSAMLKMIMRLFSEGWI